MIQTKRIWLGLALASALVGVPAWLSAQSGTIQPAAPQTTNLTLYFSCNLGSFKMLPKTELADGHVEVSFTGTLLLSGFQGKAQVTGNVNKEYEGYGRVVYFGTGKAVLDGKFRGIQWFGSNMTGSWKGNGVARLYGEFDQQLNTGKYWYDNATDKSDWGTFGMNVEVPKRMGIGPEQVTPRRRTGG